MTAAVQNIDDIATELEAMGLMPGSYDLAQIDRLRRIIATRMVETIQAVPHFPVNNDIRLDRLIEKRAQHNVQEGATKVSINDLIIKAAALALKNVPELNASYHPKAIVRHNSADIAVVVAIPGGLITPIVRNAESKSPETIAEEMRDLSARAQKMRLKPEEYIGGTFAISNLGMYGVTSFGSIINQPHGAILSVGAARKVVLPGDNGIETGTVMTVTLTCDHRVIDGVTGARWLQAFRDAIEQPDRLFGE